MDIYQFDDFREYLRNWRQIQDRKGHGLLSRWAEQLGIHPTLLSQVLAGTKELSLELADAMTQLLHLSEDEKDYFLLLVQKSRAGSESLRRHFSKKIRDAQNKSQNLSNRLKKTEDFDALAKAEFYSSWIYSAVRNLTAVDEFKTIEKISTRLRLPRELVAKVVEFLLANGLCIHQNGKLSYGPQRTHLPSTSPLVIQHHRNWREQALQKMPWQRERDLFFSFPMSLSEKDADNLRKKLPAWIEEVHKTVEPSPSETVRCLNIDFFEY